MSTEGEGLWWPRLRPQERSRWYDVRIIGAQVLCICYRCMYFHVSELGFGAAAPGEGIGIGDFAPKPNSSGESFRLR